MPTPRESGAKLFRRVFDLDGPATVNSPMPKLNNLILSEGIANGARAIRVQRADDAACGVDYQIAGEWRRVMRIPLPAFGPLVNRFKVMAALDIARQPSQHGEVHVRFKGVLHVLPIETELQGPDENVLLSVPSA